MENFQTPLKKKMNVIHSQIRSEQLSDITSKARELNRLTTKKQIQNDIFKKLITLLNLDCLNFNVLKDMKKIHKQNGFVTKQSDAIQLTKVLLKLLKMSESKTIEEQKSVGNEKIDKMNYIKSEEKQAAIKMLVGLLGLLTWNAKNYPEIAAYRDEKILQTVLEILKISTNTKIKNQCLRLTLSINQNIATKKYFFSHGLLTTLVSQKYLEHYELIQNLLTDNYNIFYFKAQKQHVDELIVLLDALKQKIYTEIDNDKVLQIHNFIELFTQQLSPQIKQYPKLFKLMFFMLKKCENIDSNEKVNEELYAKIIENIINAIANWKSVDNKEEKQCLLVHLQKFWVLNQKKVKEYENVVNEIRICQQNLSVNGTNIQELESQKGKIQSTIDRLMSLFLFIYEKIPNQPQVRIYAEKQFHNIYSQFKKGAQGSLPTSQFRFLIKHFKGFIDFDLPLIIQWCYRFMDDNYCRNECLKKLSLALKCKKIQYSEFSELKSYYDQRRVQLCGEINDEMTDFILNFSQEYQSLADIERKQVEIRKRNDEWERRQYEEKQEGTSQQAL